MRPRDAAYRPLNFQVKKLCAKSLVRLVDDLSGIIANILFDASLKTVAAKTHVKYC